MSYSEGSFVKGFVSPCLFPGDRSVEQAQQCIDQPQVTPETPAVRDTSTSENQDINHAQNNSLDTPIQDNPTETEVKICQWVDPVTSDCCMLQFHSTKKLANHVNKVHVDEGEGNDQNICYWIGCKRDKKPLWYKKVNVNVLNNVLIIVQTMFEICLLFAYWLL